MFVFAEAGLLCVAIVVDRMTSIAPVWIWAVAAAMCFMIAATIASPEWWWPWARRVFAKHQDRQQPPRLAAWIAPDGSITLEQAAFLGLDMPMQRPIPTEVQDRIAIFQNAIDQGSLHRHKRHDEDTENNFALIRWAIGHSTPIDTRVMPSELRRWSESTGYVPEFLRCKEAGAKRDKKGG